MYQRLNKRQQEARARKLEAMQRGKERARMARPLEGPEVRGIFAPAALHGEIREAAGKALTRALKRREPADKRAAALEGK